MKVDNFAFKPLQHSKSRKFGHIIDFELTSLSGRPGYISGDHQKHQLRGVADASVAEPAMRRLWKQALRKAVTLLNNRVRHQGFSAS